MFRRTARIFCASWRGVCKQRSRKGPPPHRLLFGCSRAAPFSSSSSGSSSLRLPRTGSCLLRGRTTKAYAQQLLLSAGLSLDRTHIAYNAAARDARLQNLTTDEYLAGVTQTCEDYLHGGKVHNRDWLRGQLEPIVEAKKGKRGKFVLLSGGPSVGKSIMLEELQIKHHAVLVDGRMHGGNLLSGLLDAAKSSQSKGLWEKFNSLLESIRGITIMGTGLEVDFSRTDRVVVVRQFLEALAQQTSACLIIDEANLALPLDEDKADIMSTTKSVLNALIAATKQGRHVNVVLSTSQHAFPFRLAHAGINTTHLTESIYASELQPEAMFSLLSHECGAGPHLAALLMDHYGGHVWHAYLALVKLLQSKSDFRPGQVLDVSAGLAIGSLIKRTPESIGALWDLAVKGYSPVMEADDPVAEQMSLHNVAGIVSKRSSHNLPLRYFVEGEAALIPSIQSMRIQVAAALIANRLPGEDRVVRHYLESTSVQDLKRLLRWFKHPSAKGRSSKEELVKDVMECRTAGRL